MNRNTKRKSTFAGKNNQQFYVNSEYSNCIGKNREMVYVFDFVCTMQLCMQLFQMSDENLLGLKSLVYAISDTFIHVENIFENKTKKKTNLYII